MYLPGVLGRGRDLYTEASRIRNAARECGDGLPPPQNLAYVDLIYRDCMCWLKLRTLFPCDVREYLIITHCTNQHTVRQDFVRVTTRHQPVPEFGYHSNIVAKG